jgi:uncharacterized protein (DUF2062 family)
MALGIFVGIFPTLWLGPILTVAAAGLLRANRAAALLGNVVCGPLTPITWTLSVLAGNWLVSPEWRVARELIEQGSAREMATRFFGTFLLGNVAVSLGFALLGYVAAWWLADRYRRRLKSQKTALRERATDPAPG